MSVIYGRHFGDQCPPSPETLARRAEAMIPTLRDRYDKAAGLRRLPDETVRDLRDAGLARLLQPARFGGAEGSIEAMIDILIPVAGGCPSTAWCLAQYIMHNYMVARWPEPAQQAIWSQPDALISGILIPRLGKAVAVEGGYKVSGAWPFVSGVEPSDWCILSAMVQLPKAPDEERYFLVPTIQLDILDTWRPIGLHGSGSQDVRAGDLFVPEQMSLPIAHLKGGDCPGRAVNAAPVYRLPVYMTFGVLLASAMIGMAESMFETFLMQSRARRSLMSSEETASYATHQMRVGEVSASLQAAEALLRADAREMMDYAETDRGPAELERSSYRCNGAFAGRLARQAAQTVWDLVGARGAYDSNPIARIYQDMAVASRHTTMNWEVNAAEHGRTRLRMPLSNASL